MIEAAQFYETESTGLGIDFFDDVQRVIDSVRDQPKLGVSIDEHLRRALLLRFPYSLIYSEEAGSILIVAVAHQRRRPDYWRERIDR